VWALLEDAYQLFGTFPTLLERDNNIPPLNVLMHEINKIADYQNKAGRRFTASHQSAAQATG
jgi:hypothetical protein